MYNQQINVVIILLLNVLIIRSSETNGGLTPLGRLKKVDRIEVFWAALGGRRGDITEICHCQKCLSFSSTTQGSSTVNKEQVFSILHPKNSLQPKKKQKN